MAQNRTFIARNGVAQNAKNQRVEYTYDALNHLTQVSMPRDGVTQTRTFVYDSVTQRLSSATNPENGTVTYTYNADGTLQKKTDARNQRIEYTYDTNQRVTQMRRYRSDGTEDTCQRLDSRYDTNPYDPTFTQNGQGRRTLEVWGGEACPSGGAYHQLYSYTLSGRVTAKRLKLDRDTLHADLTATWSYDNEGRVTSMTDPGYGPAFNYTYDSMGRPLGVNETGGGDIVWGAHGPAGELTVMGYWGGFGGGGMVETRTYNARLRLTTLRAASAFGINIDVEYATRRRRTTGGLRSSRTT